MKKILELDVKYTGVNVFYFAALCSMTGYASVYLLDKGFNNSMIGIVLAVANIIGMIVQPTLASYLDNHAKVDVRKVVGGFALVVTVLSLIMWLLPLNVPVIFIIITCIFAMMLSLMPLLNTLAFIFEKFGIEINYGVARGIGSVAYAVTSLGLGHIVEIYSPNLLPMFYVIFTVGLMVLLRFYVLPKTGNYSVLEKEDEAKEVDTPQLSLAEFCVKYKRFILFLLGFVGVYFAHTIINNFFIQIIDNVHGTSGDMGNAIFIAAMLELPTMAAFTKIAKKIDCALLIKISLVMFCVKHIITFFATSVALIYVAQVFQMFAYALFIPASVYYVNEKININDRIKGQSMVTLAMTLAGVIASFVGGVMLDALGVHEVLLISVVVSIVGTILGALSIEPVKTQD
ncbi:MAG: MFS transporter [Thomasclavelia sp.]|nr:MFS transporter [Thomasclavelia sp.]